MKKIICLFAVLALACTPVFAENVQYVSFNPTTKIYHSVSCPSAKVCKKCIVIDKKEAIARGGRACQKCGGR